MIKESKTFINLGIIFDEKGKVLLIRRKHLERSRKGAVLKWAFPGGKQRYDESRKECVEREVLDETGFKTKQIKEISLRVHPEFPVTVVYHLCKVIRPRKFKETKEPWEIEEIRWVKPKEIRRLITSDLDAKVALELKI